MADFDFSATPEPETITFGTPEKKVTIDITFIKSTTGARIREMILSEKSEPFYTPKLLASIIGLFTTEVTPEWIVENCDYRTLDRIVSMIYKRALSWRAEKNS